VWAQTADVEGDANGLFTYDRAVRTLDAGWLTDRNRRLLEAASTVMRDG